MLMSRHHKNRDIVVRTSSISLQRIRISELHRFCIVLFPYGNDGYRIHIPHRVVTSTGTTRGCRLREFLMYRTKYMDNYLSLVLSSKRLFH